MLALRNRIKAVEKSQGASLPAITHFVFLVSSNYSDLNIQGYKYDNIEVIRFKGEGIDDFKERTKLFLISIFENKFVTLFVIKGIYI